MLKYYFQLFRLPNIFTIPPNILAGYFITLININNVVNYFDIFILTISSIFLYIAGMITNDLFDVKKDKLENSTRPLVLGKISKSTATILSVVFFGLGIFLTLLINSISTLVISLFLVMLIISYNAKIKNGFFRPYLMGSIRATNIIFGASTFFNFYFFFNFYDLFVANFNLILLSLAVFIHTFTLTWLSKFETKPESDRVNMPLNFKNIYKKYLLILIAIFLLGFIFMPHKLYYVILFIIYLISVFILFNVKDYKKICIFLKVRFIVKYMIVLMVLLDSIFIVGATGLYPAIISFSMLIPSLILGRKIHMT